MMPEGAAGVAGNRSRKPRCPHGQRFEPSALRQPSRQGQSRPLRLSAIVWRAAPQRRAFARKADLVTAPRRKRGEVGSKPTPSTSFSNQWDDSSTGRATASQAADVGSSPTRSTNFCRTRQKLSAVAACEAPRRRTPQTPLFPSGEQGARGCLLSRVEAGSIPARGAILPSSSISPTAPMSTRSSADQSAGLRNRRPQVRILLGGPAFAPRRFGWQAGRR